MIMTSINWMWPLLRKERWFLVAAYCKFMQVGPYFIPSLAISANYIPPYFASGTDIGRATMKVINDSRTINKSMHFRPPNNLFSINELASLLEREINRILPRVTITEEDLLNAANEMRIPESIVAAITHDIFIQGCQINFTLDKPTDTEITCLYPDIALRSLDECFDDFVAVIIDEHLMAEKPAIGSSDGVILPVSEAYAITLSVA